MHFYSLLLAIITRARVRHEMINRSAELVIIYIPNKREWNENQD